MLRMRGLAPVARARTGHNWTDTEAAKSLNRDSLMLWLRRSGYHVAGRAEQEAPASTGAGRSWIGTTEDEDECAVYVGIIRQADSRGGVPRYMGMIERGITPHKVSLKHSELRQWFKRTFQEPEAKPSERGFYRAVMVWQSLGTFGGIRRERIGGKTAIPWLSRAIKASLPVIRDELHRIARMS